MVRGAYGCASMRVKVILGTVGTQVAVYLKPGEPKTQYYYLPHELPCELSKKLDEERDVVQVEPQLGRRA